ncbi:hypothetical protein [Fulvivirga ligni]|uniref:hypothetical protein n=1 Tax=Fulvivirga ligni TaxID=2904246 RepID=UPI001F233563|nr:hypothetical protein [Fulvivirga ligni]UII20758.1 hypothetical protein LVD16_23230 [Fulvivirga ligni]
MVEVYKTNLTNKNKADALITLMEDLFPEFEVNFDLDDCDNILRVKSSVWIDNSKVISLLREQQVVAEPLPDDVFSLPMFIL